MKTTLSMRLQQIAKAKQLDYKTIANDTQATYNNVARYLTGIRVPPNTFIYKFAKTYDVNFEWLVTGESSTQKHHITFDQLEDDEKYMIIALIKSDMITIFPYIKNETNYHEPYIVKDFRLMKGYSRKVMRNLMIEGCRILGYRM